MTDIAPPPTPSFFAGGAAFTSKKQRWGTPPALIPAIEQRYNVRFVLDAAADENWKCAPFYIGPTQADPKLRDVLSVDWEYAWRCMAQSTTYDPNAPARAIYMNPPYTRNATGQFVAACRQASVVLGVQVLTLIFARTDTRFWHDTIMKQSAGFDLLRGRLLFLDPDTGKPALDKKGRPQCAPAPSAVVNFDRNVDPKRRLVRSWDWKGGVVVDEEDDE